MFRLLKKVLIVNDILRLHGILTTHTRFLDKICKLLLIFYFSIEKIIIIGIFKDESDVSKLLVLRGSDAPKALSIYQNVGTEI